MEIDPINTLGRLCITRILIRFWNQTDIKRFIESKLTIIFNENMKEWEKVEEKIVEKIQKLPLPKAIQDKCTDYLRPIGLELLAWIEFHFMHLKLKPHIPDYNCWTSNGTIDLLKTAEILVEDPTLDIQDRYRLACAFCLEKSIQELWTSMGGYQPQEDDHGLTKYWSYQNQGKTSQLNTKDDEGTEISAIERAFQWSIQSANIIAAKYFFAKLNAKERERILDTFAEHLPLSMPRQCLLKDLKWEKGFFLRKYCLDFYLFAYNDLTEEQRNLCINYRKAVVRNLIWYFHEYYYRNPRTSFWKD